MSSGDVSSDPPEARLAPLAPSAPGPQPRAVPAAAPAPSRSFGALRVPAFQSFAVATVALSLGVWVAMVGQMWLVQERTNSPLALGMVNFFWGLPVMALSLLGGVVADRVDRRTVLVVARALNTLLVLLMALLVTSEWLEVWHIMAFSFLQGLLMAFDIPARQALIPALVPRSDLMSAIAIHAAIWGSTNVVGPALAGPLIATLGIAGCFYLAASASGLAAFLFFRLRTIPAPEKGAAPDPAVPPPNVLKGLAEGLRYLRGQRAIIAIMLMNLVPIVIGQAYISLIPAFAANILRGDAVTYSNLLSAGGIGALMGTALIAAVGDFRRKGLGVVLVGSTFGVALLALAATSSVWPALALMAVLGGTSMSFWTLSNTLVQGMLHDHVRARVTSVYQLTWGMQSLGNLFLGVLGNTIGVPGAIGVAGGVSLLGIALVLTKFPEVRRL
ncbi:MAG: MFS transporter [Chloroflexi bacterium]|nr:MFS transporter [Chloroflexota bacterium]